MEEVLHRPAAFLSEVCSSLSSLLSCRVWGKVPELGTLISSFSMLYLEPEGTGLPNHPSAHLHGRSVESRLTVVMLKSCLK